MFSVSGQTQFTAGCARCGVQPSRPAPNHVWRQAHALALSLIVRASAIGAVDACAAHTARHTLTFPFHACAPRGSSHAWQQRVDGVIKNSIYSGGLGPILPTVCCFCGSHDSGSAPPHGVGDAGWTGRPACCVNIWTCACMSV